MHSQIRSPHVISCSQKTSLGQMLYLADNVAYFPYQVLDEPLFIIHQINIMISVNGTNLLQSFKEVGRASLGRDPETASKFLTIRVFSVTVAVTESGRAHRSRSDGARGRGRRRRRRVAAAEGSRRCDRLTGVHHRVAGLSAAVGAEAAPENAVRLHRFVSTQGTFC